MRTYLGSARRSTLLAPKSRVLAVDLDAVYGGVRHGGRAGRNEGERDHE